MKEMTRDMWLSVGLVLILLAVLTLTALQQLRQEAEAIPLFTASDQPTGASALTRWLESLALEVEDGLQRSYVVPDGVDVAFILAPSLPLTVRERETLTSWIERGGILIVADHRIAFQSTLPASFGVEIGTLAADGLAELSDNQVLLQQGFPGPIRPVQPVSPLLAEPVLAEPLIGPTLSYFAALPEGAFVLLAQGDEPVMIVQPIGAGYQILSTISWPFANAGLREPMAPEFVLNLLAISGRPVDRVWFDEWHHGLQLSGGGEIGGGPGSWLRNTPGGHAVLFTLTLAFVALLLSGRRLGRPVPTRAETGRRAPLEYITAMANMSRRAGHRVHVQRHYHSQLKRGLGERYRLDPSLPDKEFLDRLLGYRPDLDATQVQALLGRLRERELSESELVAAANEVADLLASRRQVE